MLSSASQSLINHVGKFVSIWLVLFFCCCFFAFAQGSPPYLRVEDQGYDAGNIPIPPAPGSTAVVQQILLIDRNDNGTLDSNTQHVHRKQIDVDCIGTADGADISSIRIWSVGGYSSSDIDITLTNILQFPATVCSGIDLIVEDDGAVTLWVEVSLSENATHGRVLQLQTWIQYWEDREENPIWKWGVTDSAPEELRDVTSPTVVGVTPTALDDGDVGPVLVSITFSEAMDTTTNPSPTITVLATDPYTITGSSWSDGDTKWTGGFTFNDDDEQATGVYNISGFKDAAGNEMLPDTSHTVDVDTTEAPPDTAAVFRVTSEGDVLADGPYCGQAFVTGAADVAEWVLVSEPVGPGDVLELDPENPGHYRKSCGPCSTLIAGVVSTDPGFVLGTNPSTLNLGPWTGDSGLRPSASALLALIGIIPVKVTAEGGLIRPGDLLVSSSTSGHAMRWDQESHSPMCSFVGKALEPLTGESGLILVLLMAH
jgi:hypothetical protein